MPGVKRSGKLAGVAAVVGLAATGCSWSDLPRFGWPTGITPQADRMLHLWEVSCLAALAVGAIVWGLIFWVVAFHRKKNDDLPRQFKYNLPLELFYTGVPVIIVAVLFYFTAITENFVNDESKKPDVTVTAVAFKWNWAFEYNNVQNPATKQPVDTVGSSSDIPILVLPVDKVIRIDEHSNDVIHSFWVPKLLFKRDVIPGLNNSFQITITQRGAFVGRCAELCGTYHSAMNFELRSVSFPDYQKYLQILTRYQPGDPQYNNRQAVALAAIGLPTHAVTTHPLPSERTERKAG